MQTETRPLLRAACRCAALLRWPSSCGTPRSVPVLGPETTPCVPSPRCLGNTAFEMYTPGSRLHRRRVVEARERGMLGPPESWPLVEAWRRRLLDATQERSESR